MSQINLRPAQPQDEKAVTALSAYIWEGEDYVPHCFADWVRDRRGQFTVAYDGDQLVAFNKLSELRPGEWWLEGLRVHPDHRGRGLARLLHDNAVALAEERGEGVLRFATSSENPAVHKLAESTGFRLLSRHLRARAEPETSPEPPPFVKVGAEQLAMLQSRLEQSDNYQAASGIMEDEWGWLSIAPRLPALQEAGRLLWWPADGESLAIVHQTTENALELNFVDPAAGNLAGLLRDVRRLAGSWGADPVKSKPLSSPANKAAFLAAGWEVADDWEMWLFERQLGL